MKIGVSGGFDSDSGGFSGGGGSFGGGGASGSWWNIRRKEFLNASFFITLLLLFHTPTDHKHLLHLSPSYDELLQ